MQLRLSVCYKGKYLIQFSEVIEDLKFHVPRTLTFSDKKCKHRDSWFLLNDQRDAQFFSMYLSLFLTLYMFRAHRAHHQERQIVSIQPLVAVTLFRRLCRVQVGSDFRPAHDTATDTEWQLPEVVLTQFVSPDDEHGVLETCR